MSENNPIYPAMEVAISCVNSPDGATHERKKEGDIIVIRPVGEWDGVGNKETKERLWFRIEGLEEYEMTKLNYENYDPEPGGPAYDKRRYCIPLDRLKSVFPGLDIDRVRDVNDIYQPFLTLDSDNFTFLTSENPLEVSGLVYDKYIGDYL